MTVTFIKKCPLYFILLAVMISMFHLQGCNQKDKPLKVRNNPKKEWDQTIPGSFSTQVSVLVDSTKLNDFFKNYPDLKNYEEQVRSFYQNRKYAYAWFEKGQFTEPASNLSNRIINLQNDGIYQTTPYQKTLDSLMHHASLTVKQKKPDATLEFMLTAQYFAFAKMVYNGVDESVSKASGWNLPRKKVNYNQYLDSLIGIPAKKVDQSEPLYRQYELLKSYLKKYRDLDATDNWPPIVFEKLKIGDSSLSVLNLKKRLFKLQDFDGDTSGRIYDKTLKTAVQHFQNRMGLSSTGTVNAATLAELNVPLKARMVQIMVNMERSRWLPVTLDSDYLAVNIPEFKLHVYHADSLLWSCKVVVGQATHETTIFYGEIKYVVFSPYWNIPPSIVKNEVVPGMKKNRNYLSAHRMEITGKEGGLPVVRQKPGEANSLGLVKFLFPNSYNIYLHDTPSKSLFGESSRAFSHGCIRVVEPTKLAGFLLHTNPNWNPEKIDKAMHAGKEQYVALKKKVPVFIAYFTAFTDRENNLNFRKDIYKLDDRLSTTLIAGHIPKT
jgi:murein L,D-transpeptidase YcbB/YkuD